MTELAPRVVTGDDNFFGLPQELATLERARFVVLQAPWEGTVSYGVGTAAGPDAIREASRQVELFDEITGADHISSHGVCTLAPLRAQGAALHREIQEITSAVLELGKTPILIGGEHSVSAGAVRACHDYRLDLSILQIDAHSDLRDAYQGDRDSHASVGARFNELCPIVQVGIRARERFEPGHEDRPVHCYPAHEFRESGPWIEEAIEHLSANVYLTIDVDGFDPSVFPGTGTPEPGGLGWYTGLDLIRTLASSRTVIGFDIVEVAPIAGQQVSEFAAARLIARTIAFICAR